MASFSRVSANLIGQPMFQFLARIKELERRGAQIIHFEIGDPSFETPAPVIEAAQQSLNRGETHYTDSLGLRDLREAIVKFTAQRLGFRPALEQVLVTPANAIVDFMIRCVADPGAAVMYPDPGFPTYQAVIRYAGFRGISVPLDETRGFHMNPQTVRERLTADTRVIIVNSPSNPTGAVMAAADAKEIYEIARAHDLYILSDEVYYALTFDKPFNSPSIYDQARERVVVLNSFSKIYDMSGWRLGYALGPEKLIAKMGLLLQTIISCLPAFIQRGGIAALALPPEHVQAKVAELRRRRDVLINGLNSLPGVKCALPEGSFYAFPSIKGTGLNGEEFVEQMLTKAGVAVLSGKAFGSCGDGYVRLSYGSADVPLIKKAIEKMRSALA